MKTSNIFAISAFILGTKAHYFFDRLLVNNTWSEPWEYIRKIQPSTLVPSTHPTDYDYISPITDPSSLDLRCGRGAYTTLSLGAPKTASVLAGDTVGFAVNTTVGLPVEGSSTNPWDRYPNIYHPGPLTAWLSRSPSDSSLDTYIGDGAWVKILSVVGRAKQSVQPSDEYVWKHQWGTYQATNWTFTIPATTPPGDYLLRVEQIYPLPVDALQGSQFYTNCAHIHILSPLPPDQFGTPSPSVKIPGVYTFGQKEIYFYADVGNETYDIRDFVAPEPRAWLG